jgi:hypothetical protein
VLPQGFDHAKVTLRNHKHSKKELQKGVSTNHCSAFSASRQGKKGSWEHRGMSISALLFVLLLVLAQICRSFRVTGTGFGFAYAL